MNDMTISWMMIGLISVMTIVLLVLFRQKTRFEIFSDLIIIRDFAYPANIPNYAIKSISMVEKLPKVMMRSNGYGGLRTWKGIFRILGGKRALFYVEDHFKGPLVKIETVRESVYINFKDREQTHQLYDDLTKNVKLLNETELVDCKIVTAQRSWVIVGVFIAITLVIGLLPAIL
jgi:hypothetical protein